MNFTMKGNRLRCVPLSSLCAVFLLIASLTLFLVLKKQNPGRLLEEEEVEGSVLKASDPIQYHSERPVAHLTGANLNDGHLRYMEWETEEGLAFVKNGFIYQNGSLIVPITGRYFVYSQVYLRDKNCLESNELIMHTVNKRTQTDSAPTILISKHIQCQPYVDHLWFQTNYVGGTFTLNKGDELFAHVSDLTLLGFEENKTFFGALLV
ncbi:tumor necrosis factor ligand superfamily member 6-like isoform X1 [Hemiscyllium ocellatum]|uniref:tumor necrosis factor ligand superfamily member 6-like isoform X1 n=1 Tax=Hemiscyllium ocellatum TaxID=170820 RepID=UPI00296629B0|nr:tumor necrosis factor ligand superfamily member 6-like isoform X1 [Hemiscyllium ocellatum]